ncbi:MAG TPA: hypothetical protein VIL78_17940 [Hanamia sp.]
MKFLKIGISSEACKTSTAPKDLAPSYSIHFITSCEGEKVKWNDSVEQDAVNLIVRWELTLAHDNGFKVWYKIRSQHYRIHDNEIPPLDTDIINVIKESYLDFRTFLEKENEDTNLYNLDSDLISQTLLKLKAACNS